MPFRKIFQFGSIQFSKRPQQICSNQILDPNNISYCRNLLQANIRSQQHIVSKKLPINLIKYLGLPLGSQEGNIWVHFVSKMDKRLTTWKQIYLDWCRRL